MEFKKIYPAVSTCWWIVVKNHSIAKLSNTIKYEKVNNGTT